MFVGDGLHFPHGWWSLCRGGCGGGRKEGGMEEGGEVGVRSDSRVVAGAYMREEG
jgi:hypothetical protein